MHKQPQEREWMDAKAVFHVFGLGRTVIGRLVTEGNIKSSSLRDEGMRRGKRLYHTESIRQYLNSRMEVSQ